MKRTPAVPTMPAPKYTITFTAKEQAELLATTREPEPLGPNEVAGRTLASLVSPGTELGGFYAGHPALLPALGGKSFPCEPGYAAVFEVEDLGSAVRGIRKGDRLLCMGPHRSHQRIEASQGVPVPAGLAPAAAVFARLMAVTMSTLATTTARPPARVVVTGLGAVGNLGAQIFSRCGYDVTACDPVDARRKLAAKVGIRNVLARIPVDDDAYAGKVDLVLECSAHEAAVLEGCRIVRKRGEVVLVGCPWKRQTDLSASELQMTVFLNYVVLRSGWEWEVPFHPVDFRSGSMFANFAAALRWLQEGRVRVEELFDTVSPRDPQKLYQDMLYKRFQSLTAVFDWTALS